MKKIIEFLIVFLLFPLVFFGVNCEWEGLDVTYPTDMEDVDNWVPDIPQLGDRALFNNGAFNFTPQLGNPFSSTSMSTKEFYFEDTQAYHFTIGEPNQADLTLTDGGILNDSVGQVDMLIQNGSSVTFDSASSSCNLGKLTYNVVSGVMNFLGSHNPIAQDATINLSNSSTLNSSVNLSLGSLSSITSTDTITINAGNTLTIGALNLDDSISGVITGNGSIAKTGSGTLALTGDNSYLGTTTITGGVLQINDTDRVQGTSGITFNGGELQFTNTQSIIFSKPITLAADGTVNTTNSAVTLNYPISSVGGLIKTGSATLILSNINSYTGETTINEGTLQISDFSRISGTSGITFDGGVLKLINLSPIIFSKPITLTGDGTINATNGAVILNQPISSGGDLIKTGSGNLILEAANTYSGSTNVNAGILTVNGSLNAGGGDLTVNGGLLKGSGTINRNVNITTGSIAPGNSIGTINIVGAYVQAPGTTYEVEINNLGQTDLINITGAATINGGTVHVTAVGGYVVGTPYTILTASLGVTGTYASVDNSSLFQLLYDANNVYLMGLKTQFFIVGDNHNEKSVATQWDNLTFFPLNLSEIAHDLTMLSHEELEDALDQMSGSQYTSLIFMAQNSSERFLKKIYNPVMQRFKKTCQRACGEHANIWVDFQGGKERQHGDHNAKGYEVKDFDVSCGIHRCINDRKTLGIAFSFEDDEAHFSLNGKSHVKNYLTSLYGVLNDDKIYFFAEALGGYTQHHFHRYVQFEGVDLKYYSKPNISQFVFNLEMGLNINHGCFGLKPYAACDYGYYHRSKITETGDDPLELKIDSKRKHTSRGFVGLHFAGLKKRLTIGADVSYERRFNYSKDVMKTHFQDFGDTFTIWSYKKDHNIGHISVDLSEQFNNHLSAYINASCELSKHYHLWDVLGGFSLKW
jgi:autotransporter-associated beta strand protein